VLILPINPAFLVPQTGPAGTIVGAAADATAVESFEVSDKISDLEMKLRQHGYAEAAKKIKRELNRCQYSLGARLRADTLRLTSWLATVGMRSIVWPTRDAALPRFASQ